MNMQAGLRGRGGVRFRFSAVLALLLAAVGIEQSGSPAGLWRSSAAAQTSQPTAVGPFSAQAYLAHVKYLASDELEGRRPGTAGIELAAQYIAAQFAAAGLQPAGDEGTWFQRFEVQRGKKIVDGEALLKVDGIERAWELHRDWVPLPFSAMEDVEGPLAFAGYGIRARLHAYDDYADFDANGKILLIFRYEPKSDDPEADFGGREPSRYSLFSEKSKTAAREGARALLIVNPPLREGLSDSLYPFDEQFSERTFDLPMVHVSKELAETLVQKAGLGSLESLQQKLDSQRKPLSADLNLRITLKTGLAPNTVATRNVVGRLPGDGTTQETIVVGAHYDHLGRIRSENSGPEDPPQIHNGADDNASGTAAVIELARVLGQAGGLHRNVIFVAFSAEEMGLLGSKHFVEHPPVELQHVRAMVNFDMVGRLSAKEFTVYGIPSGKELAEIVSRAAERVGIEYRAARGTGAMFGASDHATFHAEDIPVLFAFTGVHKQYHRPEDDWELIDADGAARILEMFSHVVCELANMREGPTFQVMPEEEEAEQPPVKPAVEHEKEAREAAEAAASRPHARHGGEVERPVRPSVRLGIIPDFGGGDQPGVLARAVLEGGAAKAAGMLEGDRIIRIDGQDIKDIYGYMDALRDRCPGQTLEVVVVRKDQQISLKVTLQESRRRRGDQ